MFRLAEMNVMSYEEEKIDFQNADYQFIENMKHSELALEENNMTLKSTTGSWRAAYFNKALQPDKLYKFTFIALNPAHLIYVGLK